MKKKEITKGIQNAFNNSVPNMFDDILLKCEKKKGKLIMKETSNKETINVKEPKQRKNKIIPKLSIALASIVLVVALVYSGYGASLKVDSIIELDVNPSVEIKVNKNERVIKVDAKNKEAKEVLNEMDLKNTDIDVALNAIIGAMVTKGYIDDLSNSILVSVENNDKQKGEALRKELVNKINNILGTDDVKGSVLSQSLTTEEKEAKALANKYDISLGKAALILDVLESNKLLTEKDLVGLTINEINVLSESKSTKLTNVEKQGTASTKAYIGKTKAKEIALKHAGVSNPKALEIDFDADDGLIVYEVDFKGNKYEYDYEINAKTGKIVKVDKEVRDDYVAPSSNNSNNNNSYDYDDDYDDDDNYKPSSKPNNNTNTQKSNYISSSTAKSKAFSHAGVSNPTNVEVELDRDDNEYSVEFKANGYEYDYEINATTGSIKSHDKERIDND